jgi:hypothetical protein
MPFKALFGHVISQILNVTFCPMHHTMCHTSIFVISSSSSFFFKMTISFMPKTILILEQKI